MNDNTHKSPRKRSSVKRKSVVLTPEQKQERKAKMRKKQEERNHKNTIRKILNNMGFDRLIDISGHNFTYKERTSELDDVFVIENIVLLVEYTTDKNPGDHLLKKDHFYKRVNENPKLFLQFLKDDFPTKSFNQYYNNVISGKYQTLDFLQVKMLYCSRYDIRDEQKSVVTDTVCFFDYNKVQYFKLLTKAIKRSAIYEFLNFLSIENKNYAENILSTSSKDAYKGYVLPETKSRFKSGYKIISFYIDADSLMRRAYVLRRESWREEKNIRLYQRMLESAKITNMRKYLFEEERVFVNNIITTMSINDIELKTTSIDPNTKEEKEIYIRIDKQGNFDPNSPHVEPIQIEIQDKYNIIGIIDGQHRVYAYHEGSDSYEEKIKTLRKQQNLLVTSIIYPESESDNEKNRFEANLFLEINKNQKKLSSLLQQEIELIVSPFSTIAIGKDILKRLNSDGPLHNKLISCSYDKNKISTASIVSYGLRPLIKLDDKANDSLFRIWEEPNKNCLKDKNCNDYELRNSYIVFCEEKIRDILRAFKQHLSEKKLWEPYSIENKQGVLGVVLLNGIMNVLRLLIENNQVSTYEDYLKLLQGIDQYKFREFKSSQYRRMGEDIFNRFFKNDKKMK